MSGMQVSVAEAAELLAVHPQRIHQRIREGSLPAVKVGNQWVVEMDELRRLKGRSRPGRPLSAKSAWDLLAVAAGDRAVSGLTPAARSRARARLRNLLGRASSAEVDEVAADLDHALRNRARRALLVASPRDLLDLRDDERVHLSGVSLPESNMSAGDLVEGYVCSSDLDAVIGDYLLSAAPRSRANVVLHVVSGPAKNPAVVDLDHLVRSPLTIAADLAEHDGVREKSEAVRCLADLHSTVAGSGAVAGTNRA